MKKIIIETHKGKEVVDVTDLIDKELAKQPLEAGLCHLFLTHTTAALTTADLDPGTDLDILDAFFGIIPKLKYRHPHDPSHVPSHILSSLIGTSLMLPFEGKKLLLGTWQRVILVELDGPREREITLNIR